MIIFKVIKSEIVNACLAFPITAGVSSFCPHPSAMLMLSAVLTSRSLRCVHLTPDLEPHELIDLSLL